MLVTSDAPVPLANPIPLSARPSAAPEGAGVAGAEPFRCENGLAAAPYQKSIWSEMSQLPQGNADRKAP